jgi:hypothetical protein
MRTDSEVTLVDIGNPSITSSTIKSILHKQCTSKVKKQAKVQFSQSDAVCYFWSVNGEWSDDVERNGMQTPKESMSVGILDKCARISVPSQASKPLHIEASLDNNFAPVRFRRAFPPAIATSVSSVPAPARRFGPRRRVSPRTDRFPVRNANATSTTTIDPGQALVFRTGKPGIGGSNHLMPITEEDGGHCSKDMGLLGRHSVFKVMKLKLKEDGLRIGIVAVQ